jgi:hypothetical protein
MWTSLIWLRIVNPLINLRVRENVGIDAQVATSQEEIISMELVTSLYCGR